MIITCVYVRVKPAAVDSFIQATKLNHFGSVKEPGNARFDFIQQSDDPTSFMIYEVFEGEEAVKAHKDTDHYVVWRDTVADMMAEPRKGVRYNIIEPQERSEW